MTELSTRTSKNGWKHILPDEDYVFLYSELAAYVEKRLIGDSTRKTHDKDGNRLPEFDQQFCQICDDVEEILENVLNKESDRCLNTK
tara:strand:- start:147 stop:407 length:261 start_codon:yes stop_codon:yes gene_type:complete